LIETTYFLTLFARKLKAAITHNEFIESIAITARKTITALIVPRIEAFQCSVTSIMKQKSAFAMLSMISLCMFAAALGQIILEGRLFRSINTGYLLLAV